MIPAISLFVFILSFAFAFVSVSVRPNGTFKIVDKNDGGGEKEECYVKLSGRL